jgi:thiamine-phosphate pyrophosphorylase
MKLIVMTKPTFFVEEDKILANLFEEGLENLHLYKPGASPMYSERLLTLLGEDYHNRITVHGHFYLKEEFRLRGIHIDDAYTEPPVGYKGNISRTCHAISELKEA